MLIVKFSRIRCESAVNAANRPVVVVPIFDPNVRG